MKQETQMETKSWNIEQSLDGRVVYYPGNPGSSGAGIGVVVVAMAGLLWTLGASAAGFYLGKRSE